MLVVLVALAVTTHGRASGHEAGRCDLSSADRASEKLDLSGCELSALPASIAEFASLRHLDASNNHLDGLPELPRSLTRLFLSKNRFTSLPSQLSRLPNLTMLGMRANRLAGTLPAGVLPPSINWLILTDNQLDGLPSDLGAPSSVDDGGPARAMPRPRPCELVKLMLANNALRSLPPSMAACSRLELVRLSNNRLDEVPSWLLQLPRLAWLALASNPAVESARPPASLPTLALTDLGVDAAARPLGSGTSGVVYRGSMTPSMAARAGMTAAAGAPVAVKLYKAARTSDGLTADEARAAAMAGSHAGLVSTLALVRPSAAHGATDAGTGDSASRGEGKAPPPAGIVLEWVRGYSPLGNPPTFETISRDVYGARAGEAQGGLLDSGGLPLAQTLVTVSSICGALVHLHANQLAHGDVYAHNILVHAPSGAAKLGDFGAAFHYGGLRGSSPPSQPLAHSSSGSESPSPGIMADAAMMSAVERVEVRAFGILVAELAARIVPGSGMGSATAAQIAAVQTRLRKLASRAASERPHERPPFSEVCAQLKAVG